MNDTHTHSVLSMTHNIDSGHNQFTQPTLPHLHKYAQNVTYIRCTHTYKHTYIHSNERLSHQVIKSWRMLLPYALGMPGLHLGGGAGRGIRPPLLDVCPPLRFIVWLWHIEFASPGMPERLFCPPLKKILNAALNALIIIVKDEIFHE